MAHITSLIEQGHLGSSSWVKQVPALPWMKHICFSQIKAPCESGAASELHRQCRVSVGDALVQPNMI